MKKIIFILSVFVSLQTTAAVKEAKFTLSGKVTDTDSGFLLIRNLTKPMPDTVRILKGAFEYTGSVNEVTPFVVTDETNKYQMFFAEPKADMHIVLKRKEMQVTFIDGSVAQEIFRKLLNTQDPLQRAVEQIQQAGSKPGVNRDSIQMMIMQINNQRNANFYQFLKENGHSAVAAFLIYSSISNERGIDATVADSMYSYLTGAGKTSFYGMETEKSINKLRAVTIGYMAPDFTQPDTSGKKYTLSSFKGKYLLVDFWASWCGPCKAEIPFMKEAYEHFHAKGFEILSVSLDDKREAWINALRQFKMPWAQVSDTKGFRSIVNDLYPIPSIPKTLLLDKTGKIIATDLRGPALDSKLEELLGK
ncbi:thiol-disulfide oxidoreductase ResA [Filimonas sp.]|nr:thiol-disulfide oxidoreductase ResA [Filimonas sp.]